MREEMKEFKGIESMSKEDAIKEIKGFFKKEKRFIESASILIYSTDDFLKLFSMKFVTNDYMTSLGIYIDTDRGFKKLNYRTNKIKDAESEGNVTSHLEGFNMTVYHTKSMRQEEYTF